MDAPRNLCNHDGCNRRFKKKFSIRIAQTIYKGRLLAERFRFCSQHHRDEALCRINKINKGDKDQ